MSAGPAEVDIIIYRGAAKVFKFGPILDEDGNVLDVAGWTGKLTIRTSNTQADPPAFQKAWSLLSPTTDGKVQVVLSSTETLTLAAKKYVYSVERDNAGFEDPVVIGTCTVLYDVYHQK